MVITILSYYILINNYIIMSKWLEWSGSECILPQDWRKIETTVKCYKWVAESLRWSKYEIWGKEFTDKEITDFRDINSGKDFMQKYSSMSNLRFVEEIEWLISRLGEIFTPKESSLLISFDGNFKVLSFEQIVKLYEYSASTEKGDNWWIEGIEIHEPLPLKQRPPNDIPPDKIYFKYPNIDDWKIPNGDWFTDIEETDLPVFYDDDNEDWNDLWKNLSSDNKDPWSDPLLNNWGNN